MARSASVSVENTFAKGLITEATGLNFPENACVETYDCEFDRTGEVYRRPSFALESSPDTNTVSIDDVAITEFLWEAAGKNGNITFEVVQVGNVLHFYRINTSSNVSSNLEAFSVDISDFEVVGNPGTRNKQCSFAAGAGLLFVAHPYCNPFYISYDSDTNTIDTFEINIKVRDIKGLRNRSFLDVDFDVSYRPLVSEVSNDVIYNLLNQGWYATASCSEFLGFEIDVNQRVLAFYTEFFGKGTFAASDDDGNDRLPSESDIWWAYKTTAPAASLVKEVFTGSEINSQRDKFGSAEAPKGHYIVDAFNINRTAVSAADVAAVVSDGLTISTSGLTVESAGYQRPSQIAFFAGRVFYGGVDSSGFNTKIYFTQILDGPLNITKCYQQQDPTSENFSDLLASDGGVIEIPDLAKNVKMFAMGSSLFIFSTNGIWSITGSEGVGFTAVDYSVSPVSTVNANSPSSFVDVEGVPVWWNADGVWTVSRTEQGLAVQSLTNNTIQTFFNDIPNQSKKYVKGAYNPLTRKIQWLYRSTSVADAGENTNATEFYDYDRILVFNTDTKAFYPWRLPNTDFQIAGISCIKGEVIDSVTHTVEENGVTVQENTVDVIVTLDSLSTLTSTVFKYLILDATIPASVRLKFADNNNLTVHTDWLNETEETDFTSYFITGYKLRGEGLRKFQSNYIRLFTKNENQSQFDFYGRWDFANTGAAGRWSQVQRIVMTDTPEDYTSRRIKIRGHGIALNFKVTSVIGEPFNIIGWSSFETGNDSV